MQLDMFLTKKVRAGVGAISISLICLYAARWFSVAASATERSGAQTQPTNRLPDQIDLEVKAAWEKFAQAPSRDEREQSMVKLKSLADKSEVWFVRHSLAYFCKHPLILPIPDYRPFGVDTLYTLSAIVPLMETENQALRREINAILENCEVSRDQFDEFKPYLNFLSRQAEPEVPGPLIKRMLKASPSKSMILFMGIYAKRGEGGLPGPDIKFFRQSEHAVSEYFWCQTWDEGRLGDSRDKASAAIERLAAREEWWSRAYAAQIHKMAPELYSDASIAKLQKDPNDLVREIMNARK
jgi:hypothetical protein